MKRKAFAVLSMLWALSVNAQDLTKAEQGRLDVTGSAMKVIGVEDRQRCGQWLNNRAENSHPPFRRREGAMAGFRDVKTIQKFGNYVSKSASADGLTLWLGEAGMRRHHLAGCLLTQTAMKSGN